MSGPTETEIQPQIHQASKKLEALFELSDARNENGILLSPQEIQSKLQEYNLEELFLKCT